MDARNERLEHPRHTKQWVERLCRVDKVALQNQILILHEILLPTFHDLEKQVTMDVIDLQLQEVHIDGILSKLHRAVEQHEPVMFGMKVSKKEEASLRRITRNTCR